MKDRTCIFFVKLKDPKNNRDKTTNDAINGDDIEYIVYPSESVNGYLYASTLGEYSMYPIDEKRSALWRIVGKTRMDSRGENEDTLYWVQ
ncbi:hypothetical protein V9J15_05315 [Candidatus Liberibacter africanus]|uniref:Uncharacterized protein n=1 Tax=Candidatus Liberibacter africanus PTSAPSY TaxID=1277257 RepID=A0A0G3I9M6_LIBAF|nr:hypothetical protein [Candidatus Liberibacter africanus]AKK20482.1 hypothetical protein G293_04315 [Candidatus Liberibacter africanus PTSAPSY]